MHYPGWLAFVGNAVEQNVFAGCQLLADRRATGMKIFDYYRIRLRLMLWHDLDSCQSK